MRHMILCQIWDQKIRNYLCRIHYSSGGRSKDPNKKALDSKHDTFYEAVA